MRTFRWGVLAAVLGALVLTGNAWAAGAQSGEKRSVTSANQQAASSNGWLFECIAFSGGANTKLDCDDPYPNNEPQLTVDPANPQHMIGSSNDYGSCCDQYYTTFDAGATWSTGNMSKEDPSRTGSDPVTTFDRKHHVALHSSLNYNFNDAGETCNGDVVVSPSGDGGLSWQDPVVVANGLGCDSSPTQIFNDKEWITTDNNRHSEFYGRTYLTWTAFVAHNGHSVSSAIWEAHSDDGGHTWSKPQAISGSNRRLCGLPGDGPIGTCDQDQASVPTVGPDGTVYVAFINNQNASLVQPGETTVDNQYLLVTSRNGGEDWSRPTFVVGMQDGSRDYPINVDGRQTLTGYQVRVWAPGNIVASPVDGKLYLTFSDNRNGIHDSDHPVTNTDVFLMSSANGGHTWSGPAQVDPGAGDQWFPWVDVNPVTGKVGVLYNDRGASNGPTYTAALAQGLPGAFVKTTVSTAPSHPTQSEFFTAGVPDCPLCATFHGDYISVAYGSDGHANTLWTDMRDPSPFTAGLFSQFVYFARK